jgi:tetratricopeptide (TPR) repeat protein
MSLVEKSLLQTAKSTSTTPRYRMLETIREFGMEQMAASGEVADVRLAHATYFKNLVDEADRYVRTAEQLPWLRLLEAERDNVLAALKYFGDVGRVPDVMNLVSKLGWHWMTNGNHVDIVTWVTFALSVEGDVDPVDRLIAEAFLAVNTVAWNVRVATDEIEAGLARLKALSIEVTALVDSGKAPPMMFLLAPIIAMFSDDIPTAERLTEKAIDSDDPWLAAAIRTFRAAIAENTGDVARMRVDGEIALAKFRELGERWGLANSLQLIGQIELMEGNIEAAAAAYEEALEHAITIGSGEDVATMRLRLADILTRLGDVEGAKRHAVLGREAADLAGSPGEALFMSMIEVEIARAQGEYAAAKALCDQTMEVMRGFPYVHPIKSHGIAVILASAAKIEIDLGHDSSQAWEYVDEAYDRLQRHVDQLFRRTHGLDQIAPRQHQRVPQTPGDPRRGGGESSARYVGAGLGHRRLLRVRGAGEG